MGAFLCCCAACQVLSCAGSGCPQLSVRAANVLYLGTFVLSTILAVALQYWGAPQFQLYSFDVGCTAIPGIDADACKGDSAVYRISIGLVTWFVLITLGTLLGKQSFHVGHWCLKWSLLALFVTGLFFVPVATVAWFVPVARLVSALFLVLQIVAFIDAAYHWNTWVVQHIDAVGGAGGAGGAGTNPWMVGALSCCAALTLFSVVSLVLLYVYYGTCPVANLFITTTALVTLGVTLCQLHSVETSSSLLTSCIVTVYAVYLCWSSVHANPDPCNTFSFGTENQPSIVVGMAVTVCSLSWTCYSASTRDYFEARALINYEDCEDEDCEEEDEEEVYPNLWLFPFVMATGSVYMAMLLTNWGTHSGPKNHAQMWVSIISQWVSLLVYAWTLIAPRCLPGRTFD
jgi:hypothetical protein